LIVGERRIGHVRRHFNFPVDVDMKALFAKLEAGLLIMRVPKSHVDGESRGRVQID
jgi:HSP20 family molecular chaperone IbpA